MGREETLRLKAWQDEIAVLHSVRNEIQRLDKSGIWQYYPPELAATEEQVASAELHLGHPLDQGYRDFLQCANGWKCFTQSINLFGTEDLMGSDLMTCALEMLEVIDDAFPLSKSSGFSKEELMPIATTFEDKDLHVITKPAAHQPGVVIWFAGQEIERYPNFKTYFLSMVDYNRSEADPLKW